jgi:hypothetical protein
MLPNISPQTLITDKFTVAGNMKVLIKKRNVEELPRGNADFLSKGTHVGAQAPKNSIPWTADSQKPAFG